MPLSVVSKYRVTVSFSVPPWTNWVSGLFSPGIVMSAWVIDLSRLNDVGLYWTGTLLSGGWRPSTMNRALASLLMGDHPAASSRSGGPRRASPAGRRRTVERRARRGRWPRAGPARAARCRPRRSPRRRPPRCARPSEQPHRAGDAAAHGAAEVAAQRTADERGGGAHTRQLVHALVGDRHR